MRDGERSSLLAQVVGSEDSYLIGHRRVYQADNGWLMQVREADTLERWNALLARARGAVPLYRDRLPAGRLTSLDQVAELPFTVKDDFRRGYPFELFAVPAEE